MHGMKKKRVKRPTNNPIVEAIRHSQPMGGKDLTDLRLLELNAIDNLARGEATSKDWSWLADLFNGAEAMAKNGIGIELVPVAAEAHITLAKAAVRAKASGKWHLTTDEVWAMREAWEYADLQRLSVTLGEYRRYLKRVADIRRTGANAITAEQLLEQLNDNTV